MSNTKLGPTLSRHAFAVPISERLAAVLDTFERWRGVPATEDDLGELGKCMEMAKVIESARAKDAELIQRLVDGMWSDEGSAEWNAALDAAKAAGFKPSQP